MLMKRISLLLILLLVLCGCSNKSLALNENRSSLEPILSLAEKQDLMNDEIVSKLNGGDLKEPIIIINPYKNAPLTALMQFELDSEAAVKMIVKGRNEAANLVYEFPSSKNHILPVIGLLSDVETEVDLIINNQEYTYKLMADPLPDSVFIPEVTKEANFSMNNELYFTTPSSVGHVSAYDINGDLRWILSSNNFWDVNILSDGKLCLSTDRIINSPYYATGLVIMDMLGHIETEYGIPGGYHHDVDELPNGNLLICSDDFTRNTVEDVIVEIDRETGEIVKHFDMQDVLVTNDGKSLNWTAKDWFHNNSVDYEPTNNTLTLSGRHQDAVVVLDYDSGELKYIIGDSANWSEEYQKYFLKPIGDNFEWQWAQHAATWLDGNHIMLFDNGMNRSKDKDTALKAEDNYSRMVIYEVNPQDMTIKQVYQYGKERGFEYYSPYISDNDYLGNNHFLVTSGGVSYLDGKINNDPGSLVPYDIMNAFISEIENDELIFELKFETNIYRAEKINMTEFKLADFKISDYRGNLGETTYYKTSQSKLIKEYGEEVDTPQENYLTIAAERDRITITTTVKNSDNLELLLINDKEVRVYPLHVDATPGMCVAMFNTPDGESSLMIQTISKLGLSGEYQIAYILNDVIYDTNLNYQVN